MEKADQCPERTSRDEANRLLVLAREELQSVARFVVNAGKLEGLGFEDLVVVASSILVANTSAGNNYAIFQIVIDLLNVFFGQLLPWPISEPA